MPVEEAQRPLPAVDGGLGSVEFGAGVVEEGVPGVRVSDELEIGPLGLEHTA